MLRLRCGLRWRWSAARRSKRRSRRTYTGLRGLNPGRRHHAHHAHVALRTVEELPLVVVVFLLVDEDRLFLAGGRDPDDAGSAAKCLSPEGIGARDRSGVGIGGIAVG